MTLRARPKIPKRDLNKQTKESSVLLRGLISGNWDGVLEGMENVFRALSRSLRVLHTGTLPE